MVQQTCPVLLPMPPLLVLSSFLLIHIVLEALPQTLETPVVLLSNIVASQHWQNSIDQIFS
jgi:hypothetical protein